jgi:tetrapyrrole methylase family protein / MazG family protein
MAQGITIVGLGPGGAEHWTRAAENILLNAKELYVRTAKHPGIDILPAGIKLISFDSLYDTANHFSDVYANIAERILALGQRPEGVIYAVPGHPHVGETSVSLICEKAKALGLPVTIIPGLSFIEPTLSAIGQDGLNNLQIADATALAMLHHPPLEPDRPALIAQLYGRNMAGELKLTLMNAYPDDHLVQLVQAAGTPAQKVWSCPLFELDQQQNLDHLTTLFIPPLASAAGLTTLQETVAYLRAPNGCPWDREQTHLSLRPYLLEETYESLAALDLEDWEHLREELGDLLLQILLHAQIGSEEEEFRMADVIRDIDEKIKRRHPHVFGEVKVKDSDEVLRNWEQIKRGEKKAKGQSSTAASLLDGISPAMPSLAHAMAVSQRAAKVGFEWRNIQGVIDKIIEELEEIRTADTAVEKENELGDLLFAIVNFARWLNIDPESALRGANQKFIHRFRKMEMLAGAQGITNLAVCQMQELDQLWEAAKKEIG